jgi:hypothetical protein
MTDRLTRTIVVAAIAWLIVTPPHASAQTFAPTGRETLRGLPGVEVQVEDLEQDIEHDGLTRAAIHADVEQRLRAGGIPVYTSQGANPSDAKAYVYVLVNSVKVPRQGQYAINLQVHLRQTLRSLVAPTNIVNAMTWDQTDVMVVRTGDLPRVREVIRRFIDRFISDWKSVHG